MSETALIRVRMSQADAHYAGGLVAGGRLIELFGDVATELLVRHDGYERLFRAYAIVEFLAPVIAGDYLEVEGRIVKVGNTSREVRLEDRKLIEAERVPGSTRARLLSEPVVVARATGTCVVPKERQPC